MDKFFCAEASREIREELIGTAPNCQTYILVECPFPWQSSAFTSKAIPQNLKDIVGNIRQRGLPIKFLLINQGKHTDRDYQNSHTSQQTHLLIYDRKASQFCQGYQRREWHLDNIQVVAPIVKSYLAGEIPRREQVNSEHSAIRDILVCVHGSHDKCCARYGIPFHRQAMATIEEVGCNNIRLWQTSHFGGHRFAPTLIDLPNGRYYGGLNQSSFQSIIMGYSIEKDFKQVYRGWSILPLWLQPLELELIPIYGKAWFDCQVYYHILQQNLDENWIQVEFLVKQLNGLIHHYEAEITQDPNKILYFKSSCSAAKESEHIKYTVKSLRMSRNYAAC